MMSFSQVKTRTVVLLMVLLVVRLYYITRPAGLSDRKRSSERERMNVDDSRRRERNSSSGGGQTATAGAEADTKQFFARLTRGQLAEAQASFQHLLGEESPLQLHFLGHDVWVFLSSFDVAQKLAALGNMTVWARPHRSKVASSLWLLHQSCCNVSRGHFSHCRLSSSSFCFSSSSGLQPLPRARVIVSLLHENASSLSETMATDLASLRLGEEGGDSSECGSSGHNASHGGRHDSLSLLSEQVVREWGGQEQVEQLMPQVHGKPAASFLQTILEQYSGTSSRLKLEIRPVSARTIAIDMDCCSAPWISMFLAARYAAIDYVEPKTGVAVRGHSDKRIVSTGVSEQSRRSPVHYTCVCICMCMCLCTYIYIYIYIHTYIYIIYVHLYIHL